MLSECTEPIQINRVQLAIKFGEDVEGGGQKQNACTCKLQKLGGYDNNTSKAN